jgi:hypothetical protein
MYDKMKIHGLLKLIILLALCPIQLYSQKETFTIEEYGIKDSNFQNELYSVLFSDTIFGSKKSSQYFFAMRYDTNFVHVDYRTGKNFSAHFNIFELMDGSDVLKVTNIGKKVIGYFYIKDIPCFILNSTQHDFVLQYLIPLNKKRVFTFWNHPPNVGGFIDVYMNILPNQKIEIVRILRCE